MILQDNGKLFIIDFGLAQISNGLEQRAVDLYVLEKALVALTGNEEYINDILASYDINSDK